MPDTMTFEIAYQQFENLFLAAKAVRDAHASMDASLADKRAKHAALDEDIRRKDERTSQLHQQITELNALIAERKREFEKLTADVEALHARRVAEEGKLNAARAQLAALKTQLA